MNILPNFSQYSLLLLPNFYSLLCTGQGRGKNELSGSCGSCPPHPVLSLHLMQTRLPGAVPLLMQMCLPSATAGPDLVL